MSSSSSDASTVEMLNNVTVQINRYLGIFIFLFGTVGNILNILVLSRRTLRSNPCSWFFRISSVTSLITFFSGLSTRILSGWNLDFTRTNEIFCKCRALIVFASPTITLWLIALATIDRWLSSSPSVYRRQKSTLKNAQRGTFLIACLSFGLYIQTLICYEANRIDAPTQCYSKSSECRLLTDLSFALISILCPLFLMILFGLLTLTNIRQFHRRVDRTNNMKLNANGHENQSAKISSQERQRKKTDRQLLIMLFFQVTVLTIFTLPLPIQRFYSTFIVANSQSVLYRTIDSFLYSLSLLLFYIALGISFYIYTLSGSIFRKALYKILKTIRQTILCR